MEILAKQGAGANRPNEDDAMFSKKPLGPQACASCEKNLVNMYGMPVDYHAWKKLPFRDPNERLAKYGPGFSKMLSNMRSFSTTELPVATTEPEPRSRNPGYGSQAHGQSMDDINMASLTNDVKTPSKRVP